MKYEIAMQWADALESGKYKQGTEALRDVNNEYCCIGVLCDIAPGTKWLYRNDLYYVGQENPTHASRHVKEWSGLKTDEGRIIFKKGSLSLIKLNDERKRSFKQIAAYIRRNWEKL